MFVELKCEKRSHPPLGNKKNVYNSLSQNKSLRCSIKLHHFEAVRFWGLTNYASMDERRKEVVTRVKIPLNDSPIQNPLLVHLMDECV